MLLALTGFGRRPPRHSTSRWCGGVPVVPALHLEVTVDVDEKPATDEQREEPDLSWGPTFGPERADDAPRPVEPERRHRGWHPPGGPW